MEDSTLLLAGTAVTIGFIHTLIGPDHYLPFIVMGEARKWTIRKTMLITFLCGIGHVLSSIILGFIGIAAGISLSKLEFFESFRGNIAAWLLIAFGLVYMLISIRSLYRKKNTCTSIIIPTASCTSMNTVTTTATPTFIKAKERISPRGYFF